MHNPVRIDPGAIPGTPEQRAAQQRGGDQTLAEQGDGTAEDIAAWAGTISYEVLLGITARVPRLYMNA